MSVKFCPLSSGSSGNSLVISTQFTNILIDAGFSGKKGEMLKRIGTYAREDLEEFFGMKVYLNLWVKVKENWRDSDFSLNSFGFNPKEID